MFISRIRILLVYIWSFHGRGYAQKAGKCLHAKNSQGGALTATLFFRNNGQCHEQMSPFSGSTPAKLVPGVLPLSFQDAIDRGLKQNLGFSFRTRNSLRPGDSAGSN